MSKPTISVDEIDMVEIARSILGIPPAKAQLPPIDITRETRLHRFNDDGLHVLVDGSGGYKAHIKPCEADHQVKVGHLSDLMPVSG